MSVRAATKVGINIKNKLISVPTLKQLEAIVVN